jgi:hypothetical protein
MVTINEINLLLLRLNGKLLMPVVVVNKTIIQHSKIVPSPHIIFNNFTLAFVLYLQDHHLQLLKLNLVVQFQVVILL